MGTYAWVTVASMALFAFALWLGPCHGPPPSRVELAPGPEWMGATIDDGLRLWELSQGERLELPPGRYRVTLFAEDGRALRSELELDGQAVTLGATPDVGLSDPEGAR